MKPDLGLDLKRGCITWETTLQSQLKYPNSDRADDASLGGAMT